jgi:cell division protein FtsL
MATVIDIEEAQRIRRERRADAVTARRTGVRNERKQAERSRTSFKSGRRLLYLACIAVCIMGAVFAVSRVSALTNEKAEADKMLNQKMNQQVRLESELAVITTPEYIEEQARERLGMIKKGERLYVFNDTKEDNSQ